MRPILPCGKDFEPYHFSATGKWKGLECAAHTSWWLDFDPYPFQPMAPMAKTANPPSHGKGKARSCGSQDRK